MDSQLLIITYCWVRDLLVLDLERKWAMLKTTSFPQRYRGFKKQGGQDE